MRTQWLVLACGLMLCLGESRATETENQNLEVLPAPGAVKVDGKSDDWDLSSGIFACGDVENAAASFGVWFHAMYDRERLYLLARWVDKTPMNNPGSSKGDYGFRGDCLQVRVVTAPDVTVPEVARPGRDDNDAPKARTTHLTCWRDKDGIDVVDVAWGRRFNEGGLKNAKAEGAEQVFLEWPDHKGYTQELAIPWKLLTKPGLEVKAGDRLLMTLEPNFTVGTGGRLTIKDLFKPGVALDRVFTFQGNTGWGYAALASKGKVAPRPVRLADGRQFPVKLDGGVLVADWTGVIKSRMPEGFKAIKLSLPEDGYVSLNLFAADGTVARQLLTSHFLAKGEHEVKWDGLTTMSVRRPGTPLPAGEYAWQGIYHSGIGLRLRGWAANSGPAPWRGWGADHGNPVACASAGDMAYVGWSGGEGDKPLVACDLDANIKWKNIRGGIAGATHLACDGKTVYAFNNIKQYAALAVYRVDARTGQYTEWSDLKSTDLTMKDIWGDTKDAEASPSGLAAADGCVFISFSGQDTVFVVDAKTGKVAKKLSVPKPGDVEAASAKLIFVVSGGAQVLSVNVETGETKTAAKPALEGKDWVSALALDKPGNLYLGVRGDHHHVLAFASDGKPLRMLGRNEGRALLGPWTPDGMLNVSGMAVDSRGQLWVAEDDGSPRRVSVWDTQTGALKKELFGASSYGATGAAINPADPYLMVGQGCEWRIDPKTGRASILGTITREGMASSRFAIGSNGRLYLATTSGFLHGVHPVRIYERLGNANWKLRTILYGPSGKTKEVRVWADANDDAKEQPEEATTTAIDLGAWIEGWYLCMTQDLTFWGTRYKIPATGFTACGAPQYDLSKAVKLAGPKEGRGGMGAQLGLGSVDGKYMLYNGGYGLDHSTFDCYDVASGRLLWTYPNNFTGVHGSHRAIPAEPGLIRGAYDIVGSAKLPPPVGDVWVIPTNKGEWHVLTEKGFYLTRLFEGDPMKNVYPEQPVPGAILDTCPPGAGEEAFGGSITQGTDGKLSVQGGHVSFWNVEVVGLDTIRALPGGKVSLSDADVQTAASFRARHLQEGATAKRLKARKATPTFTGDLAKDFGNAEPIKYQKDDATACRTAVAWDDRHLYVGWEVKDATPWVNGADAPEFLYARGDTVDLQLGTDPKAPKDRKEAVLGDLRVSIGPFQGKPTVVVYRKVAAQKSPKVFSSGVVKGYEMESVIVLSDARVEVKVDAVSRRTIIEAALPMAALGIKPAAGTALGADFGATFGNKAGNDTALRSYWSNQATGLVSDEVFELKMEPANWGTLELTE
ncbi:MAG TPA: hypothetical protein VNE39_07010 [Planctomycetota bacterium]|nr:hypothetical protein [Planctomycetota bacterium]